MAVDLGLDAKLASLEANKGKEAEFMEDLVDVLNSAAHSDNTPFGDGAMASLASQSDVANQTGNGLVQSKHVSLGRGSPSLTFLGTSNQLGSNGTLGVMPSSSTDWHLGRFFYFQTDVFFFNLGLIARPQTAHTRSSLRLANGYVQLANEVRFYLRGTWSGTPPVWRLEGFAAYAGGGRSTRISSGFEFSLWSLE